MQSLAQRRLSNLQDAQGDDDPPIFPFFLLNNLRLITSMKKEEKGDRGIRGEEMRRKGYCSTQQKKNENAETE